jgi:RHS repeat-associated protein
MPSEGLLSRTLLTTTLYVGAIELQIAGTTRITSSYYFAGAQLVAMREMTNTGGVTNTLYFLHTDHLGSNSITTNASGSVLSRQSFMPYGSVRSGGVGVMPTDIGFTGQRLDAGTGGLMYYGARYYLPGLSRFASADSIVPGAGNPQAFNRYSYALSNPLRYTDPSGHCAMAPPIDTGLCLTGLVLVGGAILLGALAVGATVAIFSNPPDVVAPGRPLPMPAPAAPNADTSNKNRPQAEPAPEPLKLGPDLGLTTATPEPPLIWRGISDRKPATGDFLPGRKDTDGISFYDSKEGVFAYSDRNYAAAYDSAKLQADGYSLDYNGGKPIPGDPIATYPPGHVSVSRTEPTQWEAWYNRTDRSYAEWLKKNYERVERR